MDFATGIAIGTVIATIATILINVYYRARDDQRYEKSADNKSIQQQIDTTCQTNQKEIVKQARSGDRRLHERIDENNKQLSKLSRQIGIIDGKLEMISHSVNGGLATKITAAVKAAMEG